MSDEPAQQFTALYRENYNSVLRFVGRRVGSGVEAEEITADVFRVAWAESARGGVLSPGWLFATAHNLLRNQQRSVRRADRLHHVVAGELRSHLATNAGSDLVQDALDRLRPADREVLVLRYWDELAAREMAEVLKVSVSAVWVRLHRARRAFKAEYTTIAGGERAFD